MSDNNDSTHNNSADKTLNRYRREFLLRSGKFLAYTVPVIYSLHSTRLNAQEMSCGSTACSADATAETTATETTTTPTPQGEQTYTRTQGGP
jgi:hypothetical protein